MTSTAPGPRGWSSTASSDNERLPRAPSPTATGTEKAYPDKRCRALRRTRRAPDLRNNLIRGNGNGIFVGSGGDEESVSRDLLVDHNEFADNSVPGSYNEHHSYVEAEGTVYKFNHYADTSDGALGAALKDRSAGTGLSVTT